MTQLLRYEFTAAKQVPLSDVMLEDKRLCCLALDAPKDSGKISFVDTWLADAAASRKTIERRLVTDSGMPP